MRENLRYSSALAADHARTSPSLSPMREARSAIGRDDAHARPWKGCVSIDTAMSRGGTDVRQMVCKPARIGDWSWYFLSEQCICGRIRYLLYNQRSKNKWKRQENLQKVCSSSPSLVDRITNHLHLIKQKKQVRNSTATSSPLALVLASVRLCCSESDNSAVHPCLLCFSCRMLG